MKTLIHALGRKYQSTILQREYAAKKFVRFNERPVELAFVFRCIARCAPKSILDVGTGETALPALMAYCGPVVTAIDNVRDYWTAGMTNRHWYVIDDDISRTKLNAQFDMVTCISVLEHVVDPLPAVRNMVRLLKPGGYWVLAGPYTDAEHVDDTYKVPGADPTSANMPYICRSYSRQDLDLWLRETNCELVEDEYWRTWSGRHWALGERIAPPQPATKESGTHSCLLIRKI